MSKKTHLHTETKIKNMGLMATVTTKSKKKRPSLFCRYLFRRLGRGVLWHWVLHVYESYDCHKMPGWYSGTVGYHIDDGKIFETGFHELGREVEGMGYFDDRCTISATKICWRLET